MGGKIHVTYNELGATPGVYWAELDRTGAVVLGPRRLSDYRLTTIAGLAAQTVVLSGPTFTGDTATALELSRLGSDGPAQETPVMIARDPRGTEFVSLVLLGGDAIVTWLTGGCLGTIEIARIALR